jgi:hypothetical protein
MMFEFHKPVNCPARRLLRAAPLLGINILNTHFLDSKNSDNFALSAT